MTTTERSTSAPVTPLTDRDLELRLFRELRETGSAELRNDLVLRYQWLAHRCAARMRQRGVPMADLVQVAEIGLIKAVERFDPERGTAFSSFATPTMLGELRRHFRDHTWAVRVPRTAKDARGRVQTAVEDLHQRLGRVPHRDEIAEHCDLSPTVVADAQYANQVYRCASLEQASEVGGDAIEGAVADTTGSMDPLGAAELHVETIHEIAKLPERLQKLIVWRFYEECTQREIAERLGVGQVQVSRLLRKALAELRRLLVESPDEVKHTPRLRAS